MLRDDYRLRIEYRLGLLGIGLHQAADDGPGQLGLAESYVGT